MADGLRVRWILDGLEFNGPPDENGVQYVIETERGWSGSAKPRGSRQPRIGGHGGFRGPSYRDERIVELVGWAHAPTWEARRLAEKKLAALCSDPGLLYELRCTEETGDLTAGVELDQEIDPIIQPGGYGLEFVIQVAAPDPRKHGDWLTPASTGLPVDPPGGLDATTAGGLDATTAGGLDAGGVGSAGIVTVTNTGTADAYPLIRFNGPLASPELSDTETGEIIRYTGTLNTGEYVVINSDEFPAQGHPERSVLLGGTADRGNLLAIVGDWPVVRPGQARSWAFRAATNNTQGTAEVHLRPAWW